MMTTTTTNYCECGHIYLVHYNTRGNCVMSGCTCEEYQPPSTKQPRPEQAGGTTITKQSDLFPRYTFKVVTGRYKILDNRSDSEPRVQQIATADGEDEARVIVQALNASEQHSTLIAQRERLLDVLREMLNRFYPHTCDRGPNCAKCKALLAANGVLTTIEQEGTQRENQS